MENAIDTSRRTTRTIASVANGREYRTSGYVSAIRTDGGMRTIRFAGRGHEWFFNGALPAIGERIALFTDRSWEYVD